MTTPLWKTEIIIWSDRDPQEAEIHILAQAAVNGDSYCSRRTDEVIEDPQSDPDWDGTDFFGSGDDNVITGQLEGGDGTVVGSFEDE